MSDDKKKAKIDLKARLGKSTMGLPTPSQAGLPPGSIPPPAPSLLGSMQGIPAARPSFVAQGIAPPPSITSAAALLAPQQAPAQAPPPPEPRLSAAAQTIKVEMGEEVEQERKKMQKRATLYAVIGVVVGAGLGFVWGGASKTGDLGKRVQDGAGKLEKDVRAANDKMKELGEKIAAGQKTFSEKQFPEDLARDLGGISVAVEIDGKSVGNYPSGLQKKVFTYVQAVNDLNKTKDTLAGLLGQAKAPVQKYWKEQSDPVVNFSVMFRGDSKGVVAELVPNKEPFAFGKDWKDSYTVLKKERDKSVEKNATRYKKGDLPGTDPLVVPVAPESVAAFTSEQLVYKLGGAMRDAVRSIQGTSDEATGQETPGLLKSGEDLAIDLKKVAIAK